MLNNWVKRLVKSTKELPTFNGYLDSLGPIGIAYTQEKKGLIIHWPSFLASGRRNAFAIELLNLLKPLIEQYDVILANEENLSDERFATHLSILITNSSFLYYLNSTMNTSLALIASALKLGKCSINKHVKNKQCEHCIDVAWARSNTFVMHMKRAKTPIIASAIKLQLKKPKFFINSDNSWMQELRYWLSCIDNRDGVVPVTFAKCYGAQLLVNFDVLVSNNRDCIFANLTGMQAKGMFEKHFEGRFDSQRSKPLSEYVLAQEWSWEETLEQPYGLYLRSTILATLDKSYKSLNRQKRNTSKPRSPHTIKTASLNYQGITIQVIRRKPHGFLDHTFYYTLPYTVDITGYKSRCVVKDNGIYFWSLYGVIQLIHDAKEKELLPELTAFREWLMIQDVSMNTTSFNSLIRDSSYEAKLTSDRITGKFFKAEDDVLTAYMSIRAKLRRFGLTTEQWNEVELLLPGRSRQVIKLRIVSLGKEFAKLHGYTAYAQSIWCLGRSNNRRKRWLREGIRV